MSSNFISTIGFILGGVFAYIGWQKLFNKKENHTEDDDEI